MRLPLETFTTLILFLFASSVTAQEPVWDGNKVELVSERIAEGVFVYYARTPRSLKRLANPLRRAAVLSSAKTKFWL